MPASDKSLDDDAEGYDDDDDLYCGPVSGFHASTCKRTMTTNHNVQLDSLSLSWAFSDRR